MEETERGRRKGEDRIYGRKGVGIMRGLEEKRKEENGREEKKEKEEDVGRRKMERKEEKERGRG